MIMEFNLLIALFSGCLKFIAGKPTRQSGLPRRLRSEYKPKSCDNGVTRKIQVRAVFVARLLIMDDQRGYRRFASNDSRPSP